MRRRYITTIALAATASLALAACGGSGGPQSGGSSKLTNDKVVIGLINDQSGVYKDVSGPNSGIAIQMAIDAVSYTHLDVYKRQGPSRTP